MAPKSTDPADYQELPRAVALMVKDFPAGHVIPPHAHRRAQLAFAASGVMTLTTSEGLWVVPPYRGLWIPPATVHSVRTSTPLAMRTLYIEPDAASGLPGSVTVIDVSPLLRELILAAAEFPVLWDQHGREGRIMALILDEIRALPALPLHLPRPQEKRLARLCAAIEDAPAEPGQLDEAGRRVGASPRTLARLCRRELGMSFAAWVRRMRLLAALERLARGDSVLAVALDCGYESASAFAQMFRRHFGAPPSRYFSQSSVSANGREGMFSAPTQPS